MRSEDLVKREKYLEKIYRNSGRENINEGKREKENGERSLLFPIVRNLNL